MTLRSRGGGPLGRQTEKEREEQREGGGLFQSSGPRIREQSRHDDSI